MIRPLIVILILVVVGVVPARQFQTNAAPPVRDTAATSTFEDFPEGRAARIGSDWVGSYSNATDGVSSIVQGIGNWLLDTKTSTHRRVRIDLGDPVSGSNPNPPFQSALVPVRLISKCTTSILTLAAGQTVDCPLALSIDYGGTTYALRTNDNYAGTEPVRWTCLATNGTKCVSWSMVPAVVQTDGERKIAMQLLIPASKRTPEQLLGAFHMSFALNVSTP